MNTRSRKAVGCFALLAYLALYTLIAASIGTSLPPSLPFWVELAFYAVAGIVWIFPLKPLFAWMNKARQ